MNILQLVWLVVGMLVMFVLGASVIITMLCKALDETFVDVLILALSALKGTPKTDDK
jgi:hypothetical protein